MRRVPFNDLSRALTSQRDALLAKAATVVDSGWLIHGPHHRAFEEEFAAYLGVERALGVASGTDALELAIRAAHSRSPGNVVLCAANAGGYASAAARAAGCLPRYVDVLPDTHCLDPRAVARALDDDVIAVVVTHLYGRAAQVADIMAECRAAGIAVIEDCAQSVGARDAHGATGSTGDLGVFSFYPTKNLGALGDGGAVVGRDGELMATVALLRQYGWEGKYRMAVTGGRNSRLDELQAAFLSFRLPLVDAGNHRRREIIARYGGAAGPRIRVLPAPDESHAGHLAVVVVDDARDLATHLGDRGIGTDVHYPIPDDMQPGHPGDPQGDLPVTHGLVGRILSLPCFVELTDSEIDQVCDALAEY